MRCKQRSRLPAGLLGPAPSARGLVPLNSPVFLNSVRPAPFSLTRRPLVLHLGPSQVTSLRQDLRNSRMELVGAQEVSRWAAAGLNQRACFGRLCGGPRKPHPPPPPPPPPPRASPAKRVLCPARPQEVRGAQREAARLAGELEAMRASVAELEAGRAADRAELAQAKALNSALQAQVCGWGLPAGASPLPKRCWHALWGRGTGSGICQQQHG